MENYLYGRRNLAIDMLRGLVMTLMIFVNDSWTVLNVPHWMLHAKLNEDFMGLADIVFPSFLFVMGMSIPYAIESRIRKGKDVLGHILLRSLALIVMGAFFVCENQTTGNRPLFIGLMLLGFFLTWNDYTKKINKAVKTILQCCGIALLLYLMFTFRSKNGGVFYEEWGGILGTLGWAYLISAVIYLIVRDNLGALGLALAFFVTMCLLFTPMRDGTIILDLPEPNFFDSLAKSLHFRNGCHIALVLGGALLSVISVRMQDVKAETRFLMAIGTALALFGSGVLARQGWIVSKAQSTAPWLLWTSAICVASYSFLRLLEDKGKTGWFAPFRPAGTATLTAYMVPYLFIIAWILIDPQIPSWLTGWVGQIKCLVYTAAVLGVTWALVKLGIKLKI